MRDEELARILLQRGVVSEAQLDELSPQMTPGVSLAAALIAGNIVGEQELAAITGDPMASVAVPALVGAGNGASAPATEAPSQGGALYDVVRPGARQEQPPAPARSAPVPSLPAAAQPPAAMAQATRGKDAETRIVISELLQAMLKYGASDLHVTAGARPAVRVNGELKQLEEFPVLFPTEIQAMIYSILTQKQREKLESEMELDCAHTLPGKARFRLNCYFQRDSVGAAFRVIPVEIKPLEDLGIPPQVANFARLKRGFVLVTGPTGSGKSTTLASIVDLANRERSDHIMTVEDPIEFLHKHKQCLVNQREVGEDTKSFSSALKHVLRQDPDIILVGEMRDLETISIALTAAETGHLVFATLHTQDAPQTIDRIIDVFPTNQQQQVRAMLAAALQGVVCQQLVPTLDGSGRAVAVEIMMATPAIRNLIRDGKTHQIYSAMQAGGKHGMQTMDQALADLVKRHKISYNQGLERCQHVEDFNRLAGHV